MVKPAIGRRLISGEGCASEWMQRFRSLLPLAAAIGLFVASNSEASLWASAQEAGARADVPQAVVMVPVEKIADEAARDAYWVIGSHSADLYFTALAIERCNGACNEGNPLGHTAEARIALKMASTASTMLTIWKLRRDGHGKTATVIRWATVAFNAALVANNARHAIRRR